MSKTARIVQICDHVVITENIELKQATITRGNKDYDIIDNTYTVSSIKLVAQNDDLYFENSDFVLYTHNKIQWIGVNRPESGSEYSVLYEVRTLDESRFVIDSCPKCSGTGWYVSLFGGTSKFSSIEGLNKMIQDFIKILLTNRNEVFGTHLVSLPGSEISNPSSMSNEIILAIQDAELQYKDIQADLAAQGTPLPDDEKLYRIDIRDVNFDPETFSFIASLTAYNYLNQSADFNFKI